MNKPIQQIIQQYKQQQVYSDLTKIQQQFTQHNNDFKNKGDKQDVQ